MGVAYGALKWTLMGARGGRVHSSTNQQTAAAAPQAGGDAKQVIMTPCDITYELIDHDIFAQYVLINASI